MPVENISGTADLSKLTVAQLKALCKERKLAGYSKLGKQALIQKLQENGYSPHSNASNLPGNAVVCLSAAPGPPAALEPLVCPGPEVTRIPQSTLTPTPSLSKAADRGGSTSLSAASLCTPTSKAKTKTKAPKTALPKVAAGSTTTNDDSGAAVSLHSVTNGPNDPPGGTNPPGSPSTALYSAGATDPACTLGPTVAASNTPASGSTLLSSKAQGKSSKRPTASKAMPPPAKKARIQPPPPTAKDTSTTLLIPPAPPVTRRPSTSGTADVSRPVQIPPLADIATRTIAGGLKSLAAAPAKRFRPLVVDKSKVRPSNVLAAGAASVGAHQPQSAEVVLSSLDLPSPSAVLPALRSITLPPPLAQRKRVARWAVILSGLSDKERAVCVLVSRTIRYAVYLSASSILLREYGGKRLQEDVLCKYSPAMTNMWPYLRVREAEVSERRRIYEASFLSRFFQRSGHPNAIARRLWASPDNPKQLTIAMRFALTRVWFELSVGSSSGAKDDPASWLRGSIVDVQEVIKDEIWSVTVEYPAEDSLPQKARRETIYVIEATCEMVGRAEPTTPDYDVDKPISLPARADWSSYIARRVAPSSKEEPLLSHLKWSCHEEFERGISRLWLKRIAGEGELGMAKRVVAERYVLACVVGNSFSGKWLSANEMAQDFAGLPSRGVGPAPSKLKDPSVNLYLPEHHHVESVHFTATKGDPLHAALAVVQTPHREYYILRDNGMQVGCEEEGVAAVWQEVLGCDSRGQPKM
ncbi:hypothetical protein OH77DRAFT_1450773 [Trametes cingulata]|nr:hypothetical protein OH77DRAFT_1450773 [Trametes cingulata]